MSSFTDRLVRILLAGSDFKCFIQCQALKTTWKGKFFQAVEIVAQLPATKRLVGRFCSDTQWRWLVEPAKNSPPRFGLEFEIFT